MIKNKESDTCIRGEVLTTLGLTSYCCRRMFLGHVDIIDQLLKYSNNPGEGNSPIFNPDTFTEDITIPVIKKGYVFEPESDGDDGDDCDIGDDGDDGDADDCDIGQEEYDDDDDYNGDNYDGNDWGDDD